MQTLNGQLEDHKEQIAEFDKKGFGPFTSGKQWVFTVNLTTGAFPNRVPEQLS